MAATSVFGVGGLSICVIGSICAVLGCEIAGEMTTCAHIFFLLLAGLQKVLDLFEL